MNALVPVAQSNAELYRASTDAAGLCGAIVKQTAQNIGGRRYVRVEGWQALAIAHGCAASADHVERVNDEGASGFRAVGIVRRMSDGAEIARAEGFLGDDEAMWTKRPVYARRAMVQTRAISRACRSAFAHVVVMIDANLSTTPAEEVPDGGFDDVPRSAAPREVTRPRTVNREPVQPDFPGDAPGEPKVKPATLADEARLFEAEMRACKTVAALKVSWDRHSGLCGRLDTADPDILAHLEHTYDETLAALEARKAA